MLCAATSAAREGWSGMRWLIEPKELPADYRVGQVIRVLEKAPPPTAVSKE